MASCGPSYAIPSCASSPVVGFGSAGSQYGGLGTLGSGALVPSGVPSASLGILPGIIPNCINQIPPAEVMIQPPPVVLTIPGPILSATGEPVSVGGNTPCAVSYGGSGRGLYGGSGRGLYGSGALEGRLGSCGFGRSNVLPASGGVSCLRPC